MKKILEFKCPEHGVFEAFTDSKEYAPCPECDEWSSLVFSVPNFYLDGTSGDFPTAADKWAKDHEKKAEKSAREQETLKRWGE